MKSSRKGIRKLFFLLFLFTLLISFINIFLLLPQYVIDIIPIPSFISRDTKDEINSNYFLNVKSLKDKWLVDQTNCKIPDIFPWDASIMHLMALPKPREECWKTHFHWTYIENTAIVMNESDIAESGYQISNIRCCYHIIRRRKQDEDNYNAEADNLVSYSETCFEMEQVTRPTTGEFFQVKCFTNSWTGKMHAPYIQYHAIPNINEGIRGNTKSKAEYWRKRFVNETKESEIPPNIIFVGLDSTSRINVHRNMFKTVQALNDIGAIEMLGYTKVGENTFPNFLALFTGYSWDDLTEICLQSLDLKQDDCPFIWRRLDEANYYTSQIEDRPSFTGFNYLKTGFVHQPVDLYLRPLFLAAHENSPDMLNTLHIVKNDYLDCIGYKSNDEVIVEYIDSVVNFSHTNKVPLFSLSWSTTLTHNIINDCQLVDDLYANLILSFQSDTARANTIFIFLSDHGYRYGKFRETLTGWYEEKLPALWIYLPPAIKKRFPTWEQSLIVNSRRLISTFHLHWTINHILDEFTNTELLPDEKSKRNGNIIPRKYKYSLFNPVPENWTCEDVGVPETFCACYPLQSVEDSDPNLLRAAEHAIETVNLFLPQDDCAVLKVNKLVGGALLDKTALIVDKRITYIVAFTSNPGDFLFEADIDFYPEENTFNSKANVLRTSKINTDVSCVKDPKWEQYCYCKFLMP